MRVSQAQQKTLRADYYFRGACCASAPASNSVVWQEDAGGTPVAVSRFFPPCFPKRNALSNDEKTPRSFTVSATIRGTMCQFVIPRNLWSIHVFLKWIQHLARVIYENEHLSASGNIWIFIPEEYLFVLYGNDKLSAISLTLQRDSCRDYIKIWEYIYEVFIANIYQLQMIVELNRISLNIEVY